MFRQALAGVLLLTASISFTADADKPKEATIYFADEGSIENFEPVDTHTLYIEDVHSRSYKATMLGSCIDLPYATAVHFDVRGTHQLDRNSSVVVNGQNCPFTSLVESEPPPGWKTPKHRD